MPTGIAHAHRYVIDGDECRCGECGALLSVWVRQRPWLVSETTDGRVVIYVEDEEPGRATVLFEADWGTRAEAEFIVQLVNDASGHVEVIS